MRGFLITLLVLGALLVGIDFAARWIAEDRVAAQLETRLELPTTPELEINGFPFLTQALSGTYPAVTLTAQNIPYRELENITLSADLVDVSLPPQTLLDGRVESIPARTATATAAIDPLDLARLLRVEDVTVEPVTEADLEARRASGSTAEEALEGVEPSEAVEVISTTTVLGQDVRTSVIATFRLADGEIELSGRDIALEVGDASAPEGLLDGLSGRLSGFSTRVDPGQLPFSITATDLRAEDGRLVVSGTAEDVDLLGGSL